MKKKKLDKRISRLFVMISGITGRVSLLEMKYHSFECGAQEQMVRDREAWTKEKIEEALARTTPPPPPPRAPAPAKPKRKRR